VGARRRRAGQCDVGGDHRGRRVRRRRRDDQGRGRRRDAPTRGNVAAAAVDELLDIEALARLRASADNAAQTALPHGPGPDTYFPNVLAFVTEHLTPMYRRSLSGTDRTWCAEWWRHTEAVSRLEALWRSWEYLRLDPNLGISVWMRDHLDHHMAILLDADGPFKGCKPDQHAQRLEALPLKPPVPANLFDVQ
jgi:uncharacterized protein DUF4913